MILSVKTGIKCLFLRAPRSVRYLLWFSQLRYDDKVSVGGKTPFPWCHSGFFVKVSDHETGLRCVLLSPPYSTKTSDVSIDFVAEVSLVMESHSTRGRSR